MKNNTVHIIREALPGDCVEHMQSHIDKVIGYAINEWAKSSRTKGQVISTTVGHFVYDLLQAFCPNISLDLVLCDDIERVNINLMLDGHGTIGTRIGALAYVVAVQLEFLLQEDNNGSSDIYLVKVYDDHTCEILDEKNPDNTISISACYAKYIDSDRFVYTTFLKPNIDRLNKDCANN